MAYGLSKATGVRKVQHMSRAKQESESIELAILLALSGGIMDAYSYLVRDHVFANAQTGNMLLFGVNLATGDWAQCLHYAVPVVCFAAGIALCHTIKIVATEEHLHWRQMALIIEAVLLVVVGFVPEGRSLYANGLTSFACGIQVQAFRKFHGRPLATTMCIGNLRSGTQALVTYASGRDQKQLRGGLLSFFVITCFVLGAVIGNWAIPALGTHMIWIAPVLLAVSFLIMFVDREKRRVEVLVGQDLEADLEGEAAPAAPKPLSGVAGAEERLAEGIAADVERRHGRDIEMGVMHKMGLTSEGGDEHEGAMERDVEAQIEQHLRDHIARGGFRARK